MRGGRAAGRGPGYDMGTQRARHGGCTVTWRRGVGRGDAGVVMWGHGQEPGMMRTQRGGMETRAGRGDAGKANELLAKKR
jgi:hypothetical protein